jgi:hypothetical protein
LKNDMYFLSYQADTNGSIFLSTALLRRVGDTKLSTWGGFNFTMKYYPPSHYGDDTKIITKTISVPTYKVESNQDTALLGVDVVIAGPRTPTNPLITGFPDTVVLDTIDESLIAAGNTILTPQTFSGSYTLLAGDYSPTNLASSISQLLVNNFAVYPQLEGDVVSSQFLKQSSQIPSNFPDDNDPTTGDSLQRTQIFLKGDGTMMNQYVYTDFVSPTNIGPAENYIFGANQVALEWDPELLRFKWTYLHQPFYDSKGNEAIKYIKTSLVYGVPGQVNNGQTYAPVNATGGICFSDLSATYTDSDGKIQTYDFWENVLGFDLKTLIPSFKHNLDAGSIFNAIDTSDTPFLRVFYNYEMSNVVRGNSFTSNFLGIDSMIDKINYKMAVANLFNADFTSTSTFTYAIVGNRTYNETTNYGYFLLEINAGFANNDFISETAIKHNIQAIISKYYSQASYTTGSEADGIVYTHLSDTTIYLNTIKIRVLNSDGTLATDIGPDNTVFLKLVKNMANLKPFTEIKK